MMGFQLRRLKFVLTLYFIHLHWFSKTHLLQVFLPTIGKKLILLQLKKKKKRKKEDKQIVSNYVSLLLICSKTFEKLIFNELFAFFEKRNLLSKHESGFHPGDSCIYQLLAITHDIFLSFDTNHSLESAENS